MDDQMENRGAPAHSLILPFPWVYPGSCRMDPNCPLLAQVGVLSPVVMSHTGGGVDTIPWSQTPTVTTQDEPPAWKALGGVLGVCAGAGAGWGVTGCWVGCRALSPVGWSPEPFQGINAGAGYEAESSDLAVSYLCNIEVGVTPGDRIQEFLPVEFTLNQPILRVMNSYS